jgi:hypothetical protein
MVQTRGSVTGAGVENKDFNLYTDIATNKYYRFI